MADEIIDVAIENNFDIELGASQGEMTLVPQDIDVELGAQEIAVEMGAQDINVEITGVTVPTGTVSNSAIFEAGQTISALRVIRISALGKAIYASSAVALDISTAIGVSITSAITGNNVMIVTNGEIEDLTWNWIPSAPIFLGVDGVLTQTPPTSGFLQIVGNAETSTKMKVNIQQAIKLI